MNPGISEEAGKVATATVGALSSTPVVLALVLFNIIFLFLVGYMTIENNRRWDREVERWVELVRACQNVTIREKQP